MQTIEVYLDWPLYGGLISWIQDATLLWMVSQIGMTKVKMRKLLLGGFIGGIFQFAVLVNKASEGWLCPWIWSPFIFVLAPLVMMGITFLPLHRRKFLHIIGLFYLLSFLLAGFNWGIDVVSELYLSWEISFGWRFWIHEALIFLLGELGWGVVHRKAWEYLCLYPILIQWDEQELSLNALLDTGNRLHDPLTRVPVVIVELEKIKDRLPVEVKDLVETMRNGGWEGDWKLPREWEERVRLLPFQSLGKEHGMLVGFRPDMVRVWQKKQEIVSRNVVIGLYDRPLSPEGAFDALIPLAVLKP